MKLEKIGKDQEKKLVRGVEQVISQVKTAGLNPTEALVKVAKEFDFEPEEVRRVSEAYNISKSLANQKEKQGSDRTEPFDLAHADLAIKQMYPSSYKTTGQEKQAATTVARANLDSARPINYMSKTASFNEVTREDFKAMTKVAGLVDAPERPEQKAARMEKQAQRDAVALSSAEEDCNRKKFNLLDALTKAAAAIRSYEIPFDRIEQSIVYKYGEGAIKLADLLFNTAKQASFKCKRASEFGPVVENYNQEPYTSIDAFVTATSQFKAASEKFASLSAKAKAEGSWTDRFLEKRAILGAASEVFNRFNQGLKTSPDGAYDQEVSKAIYKINDPKYTNELRRVRIQSMLTDWVSNDEVLRNMSRSPAGMEKILNAYNDLASVSPEAAENPALAKSYVRRTVQTDSTDPFDIGQMANIGGQLKANDEASISGLAAMWEADPRKWAPWSVARGANTGGDGIAAMLGGKTSPKFTDPQLAMQQQGLNQNAAQMNLERNKFNYQKGNDSRVLNGENTRHSKTLAVQNRAQTVQGALQMQELGNNIGPSNYRASDPALANTIKAHKKNLDSILGSN